MRTRQEGQSSSDEEHNDDGETTPLVAARPPPPVPRPPPRGQTAAAAMPPPPPPPAAARPPAAPSPQQRTQIHTVRKPSPRVQNPRQQHIGHPPAPPFPLPPLPPPAYPPPPSPPPPPAMSASDWVLKLRHPGRGVLRIHVPKGMTAHLLSKCIVQATDFSEDSAVVGLFGYNNGMFVSLEHLIACEGQGDADRLQKQLYSLDIPEPLPKLPWWQDWRIFLAGFVLIAALLWQHALTIGQMIAAIPAFLVEAFEQMCYYLPLFYHTLVTRPLKETYRYGPAVLGGWEGADLEAICARMTYGDRDFWERNYRDCENMYLAKESAYLFIGRPLVFLVLLLIGLWILRQWLWYHALQDRDRYQDRDMIQTYRAIQVLLRQMGRMARMEDRGRRQHIQGRDDYGHD